jgi:hypothetical protein
MSKIYVQNFESAWTETGTLAGSTAGVGGSTSGSFSTKGYARLIGTMQLGASTQAGSGFQVFQSTDGTNWDCRSACLATAAGGSGFSYEIIGTYAMIKISNGSSANAYRTAWYLRPI